MMTIVLVSVDVVVDDVVSFDVEAYSIVVVVVVLVTLVEAAMHLDVNLSMISEVAVTIKWVVTDIS